MTPAFHTGTSVADLATSLWTQLPAPRLEKAAEDSSSGWIPITHVGVLDKTLGSWLDPDAVLIIASV